MTTLNQNDSTATLRDIANAFSQQRVGAMVSKVKKSFERRDAFETLQGLNISEKNSYTVERDRMLKAGVAVAMLFLALDIEPSDVIERKVASNAMFNAKALKKVTELARFACGHGEKLEKVTRCFLACAIAATDKGVAVIDNSVNRRFLNSDSLDSLVTDAELREELRDHRLRSMTSGDATQSSQIRNVLDVLGVGEIRSLDKPRDAIALDATHGLVEAFRARFMTKA